MKSFSKMVYPYVIWAMAMIVAPMLMIVLYAFTVKGNSVLTFQFTIDNFVRFFSDPVFPGVLWRSLKLAVITTLICIAVGYPSAYIIAKLKPNSQALMILLITLPTWINMLVRTYAWRGILAHLTISGEMKVYIGLCMKGESSIPERKEILARKREALLKRMNQLQESIDYIDWKQGFYDDVLSGKTKYYSNLIAAVEE